MGMTKSMIKTRLFAAVRLHTLLCTANRNYSDTAHKTPT